MARIVFDFRDVDEDRHLATLIAEGLVESCDECGQYHPKYADDPEADERVETAIHDRLDVLEGKRKSRPN